jgi:hypothetical protein
MDDILDRIAKQKAHFGEHMQPGCSQEVVERLLTEAKQHLKVPIPESYIAFLRRTNGLDWNGTIFFAAMPTPNYDNPHVTLDGFVQGNQRLREIPANNNFLVFGESGMEMYVCDLHTSRFNIVDHISTDAYDSFDSFEELLCAALEKRLLKGI